MAKKGCFNTMCVSHSDQEKYKKEYVFCPMCANKLIYVCGGSKCYKPLHNVRKRYCDECLVERAERKASKNGQTVEKAKNVGVIAGVAAGIVGSVVAVKNGVEQFIPKK